jgi:hypothetical protein
MKMAPVGQVDGPKWDGDAIRAFVLNVYVVKQVVMLVTGTSENAQLVSPPPTFHTG